MLKEKTNYRANTLLWHYFGVRRFQKPDCKFFKLWSVSAEVFIWSIKLVLTCCLEHSVLQWCCIFRAKKRESARAQIVGSTHVWSRNQNNPQPPTNLPETRCFFPNLDLFGWTNRRIRQHPTTPISDTRTCLRAQKYFWKIDNDRKENSAASTLACG